MTTNITELKAAYDLAWSEHQAACAYWHANKGKPGVSARPHFEATKRYEAAARAYRAAKFPEAEARSAARLAEARANRA